MTDPLAPLRDALRDELLPALVLDLDAFGANADRLGRDATDARPIRVASKSFRVPRAFDALLARPHHRGLLTFSAPETAWLAERGYGDLLLAYPVARRPEAECVARAVATGASVRCVVDSEDHVALLGEVARARGLTLRVCLDVDASWRPGGVHLGVRRSPVRSLADALRVAGAVERTPGVVLDAVMAYEAQVAGVRDRTPGGSWADPPKRFVKARSVRHVARLRAEVVEGLRAAGVPITLVNGGGTGSVDSTAADPVVTELSCGSGYFAPHLFDGYDGLALRPALFVALPVVRSPDPGFATCFGGGYIASGEAGPSRSPLAVSPPGLAPLRLEGWGEVQTPLTGPAAPGGLVLARPAKAGEPTERFAELVVVSGGAVVDRWPTYRGLGLATG